MPIACPTPWGGADRFLDFIETDLKPLIASKYPTDPSHQAVSGHSFGGLLALYVLFTHPESFQTYVAASLSITWGEPAITAAEARFAAETEARLLEFRMIDQARNLVDRLNELERYHLAAEFRLFEGEGHMSLVPASAAFSLRFVTACTTAKLEDGGDRGRS